MATYKAYYRVTMIRLMKGRRFKVLVLERTEKPKFPKNTP